MKIDYALMSCDENPFYADFWPIVSASWRRIGVMPVLVRIVESSEGIEFSESKQITEYGIEFRYNRIEGVKVNFQALNARIWLWKVLEGNCILSDIDMMVLSEKYFNATAAQYSDDKLVSYSSDAIKHFGQYASCYILASTKVMAPLIPGDTWAEFLKWMSEMTGQGWGGDQWFLGECIKKHPHVVHNHRGFNEAGQAHNRIDRDNWHFADNDVKDGRYFDAHLLRPFSQHKGEIERLYRLLT